MLGGTHANGLSVWAEQVAHFETVTELDTPEAPLVSHTALVLKGGEMPRQRGICADQMRFAALIGTA